MPNRGAHDPRREARGAVHVGAAEAVQARDQARPCLEGPRELHRRAEGGVHQVADQPEEGEEAGGEEVVL